MLEKCTQLRSVNFCLCQLLTGESSGGRFLSELRTSPLFLWNFPFFGVTDSALPTLFSTSLLSPLRSHGPLSVCARHCYPVGDIKVLEKCTQLTSVNFEECEVTGESSGGRFLSELRTTAFPEEFSVHFSCVFPFLYLSHRRTILEFS